MNQNTKFALYLGEICHKNCSNSLLLGFVDMCTLFLGMHFTLLYGEGHYNCYALPLAHLPSNGTCLFELS